MSLDTPDIIAMLYIIGPGDKKKPRHHFQIKCNPDAVY